MDKRRERKGKKGRPAVDQYWVKVGFFFSFKKRVAGGLFFWKRKGIEKQELPGGCRLKKIYQAAVKFARLSRCEMYCNVKIRKGGENSKLASEVSTKDEKKIKIKIKILARTRW